MVKGRFLTETHLWTGRPLAKLAAAHGVHRSWLYKLLARYRREGEAGLEPRSRRPRRSPARIADRYEEAIVTLRKELPNACWQADVTHWRLADGTEVDVLTAIDDHSRLCVASRVFASTRTADVVRTLHQSAAGLGYPASVLTDSGSVFTATSRGGFSAFGTEVFALGIVTKYGRPYHPQTQGKVERFHQTLKRHLTNQDPTTTKRQLQAQLDRFVASDNEVRPHRGIGRRTPAEVYGAREKAVPTAPLVDCAGYRVR